MSIKTILSQKRNNGIDFTDTTTWLISVLCISTMISFIISLLALFENNGCELLFLLPVSFGFLLIISRCKFLDFPMNIGAVLIAGIEFVKLVLVPMLYVLSGFPKTIGYNALTNDYYGILLQAYEALWIGYAISRGSRYKEEKLNVESIENKKSNKKLRYLLAAVLLGTFFICAIAPEILLNYRSILSVTDSQYTNIEQSYIVNQYATSTFKKFFLVLANYWLKPVRLIFPAVIMVVLKKTNKKWTKPLALLVAVSPMMIIDGTVARSLYFTLVLLLLYYYLYKVETKMLVAVVVAAGVFIIVYWCIRFFAVDRNNTLFVYFAEKFNDYFCGFNIVGATLNLPDGIDFRIKYFLYDFIRTIPFANTLFGLDAADTVRNFFNAFSKTTGGQIASTLGMSSYYLTPLLAPLYSYIFARNAINYSGLANDIKNPYYKMVYYFIALYFTLGIGLNDISTTLSNLVQVAFPIYLIVRIAYPKKAIKKEIGQ